MTTTLFLSGCSGIDSGSGLVNALKEGNTCFSKSKAPFDECEQRYFVSSHGRDGLRAVPGVWTFSYDRGAVKQNSPGALALGEVTSSDAP